MPVTRIVPNLRVSDPTSAAAFYSEVLDLRVRMDIGWVANLAPDGSPDVQLQVMSDDARAAEDPVLSVGVASPAEVDVVHAMVVERGLEVVHPPTDEDWGVRRFFFRDPDGNVVNVVANR